jgi:hypothetical protein
MVATLVEVSGGNGSGSEKCTLVVEGLSPAATVTLSALHGVQLETGPVVRAEFVLTPVAPSLSGSNRATYTERSGGLRHRRSNSALPSARFQTDALRRTPMSARQRHDRRGPSPAAPIAAVLSFARLGPHPPPQLPEAHRLALHQQADADDPAGGPDDGEHCEQREGEAEAHLPGGRALGEREA